MKTLQDIRENFFDNVGATPDTSLRKNLLFKEITIFAELYDDSLSTLSNIFQAPNVNVIINDMIPGLYNSTYITANDKQFNIKSIDNTWYICRDSSEYINNYKCQSFKDLENIWKDVSYSKQFYEIIGLNNEKTLNDGFVVKNSVWGSKFILIICPYTMDKNKDVKKLPKWVTNIKGGTGNNLVVYITGMENLEDISDLPSDIHRLCITNCPKLKLSGLPKGLKISEDFIYLPDKESKFELREISRYVRRVAGKLVVNRAEFTYPDKKPLKSTSDIRKETSSTSTTKSSSGTRFKLIPQPDSVSPADLPEWKMDHLVLYSDDNIEVGKANKAMTFIYRNMVKYMTIGKKDGYTIGNNMKGQQICRIKVVG